MSDATLPTGSLPSPSLLPSGVPYDPYPKVIAPYIGAVFMETFLYGIYCVLFSICAFVLLRRNKTLHWVLLVYAICMFALASADIGYTFYIFFGKLLVGKLGFGSLYPKYVLFVTNNVLADSLLLYRCYVVWGYKKRIVAGPVLLLLAGTVCGYLFEGASMHLFQHSWIYLAMTLALNVILTGLTAGRIWFLARNAGSIIGQGLLERYNASIAILIESGVIYSFYIVLVLAFHHNPTANVILDAGLIQIVGIVPTLVIVQVGVGRAVSDLESGRRIEAASGASGERGEEGSVRLSLRSAIRSHRASNATSVGQLDVMRADHRRSTIQRGGRGRRGSLYCDMGLESDGYTSPLRTVVHSPTLPLPLSRVWSDASSVGDNASPVLVKPELSRSDVEVYECQPFGDGMGIELGNVNSRESRESVRSGRTVFSAL